MLNKHGSSLAMAFFPGSQYFYAYELTSRKIVLHHIHAISIETLKSL